MESSFTIATIRKTMNGILKTIQDSTNPDRFDIILNTPNIPEMVADNMLNSDIFIQQAGLIFRTARVLHENVKQQRYSLDDCCATLTQQITSWLAHTTQVVVETEPIPLNPPKSRPLGNIVKQPKPTELEEELPQIQSHESVSKQEETCDSKKKKTKLEDVDQKKEKISTKKAKVDQDDTTKDTEAKAPENKPKRKYVRKKKPADDDDDDVKDTEAKAPEKKPKRKYVRKKKPIDDDDDDDVKDTEVKAPEKKPKRKYVRKKKPTDDDDVKDTEAKAPEKKPKRKYVRKKKTKASDHGAQKSEKKPKSDSLEEMNE